MGCSPPGQRSALPSCARRDHRRRARGRQLRPTTRARLRTMQEQATRLQSRRPQGKPRRHRPRCAQDRIPALQCARRSRRPTRCAPNLRRQRRMLLEAPSSLRAMNPRSRSTESRDVDQELVRARRRLAFRETDRWSKRIRSSPRNSCRNRADSSPQRLPPSSRCLHRSTQPLFRVRSLWACVPQSRRVRDVSAECRRRMR